MIRIRRTLISVSDKTGIAELGEALTAAGVEIVSTGGTAALLEERGLKVTRISEVTGFPEILDGRVKTLTPQVHGALLARRDREDHLRQIQELGITPIDLVVVNLYPFEETIRRPGVSFEEAVEQIDIGGPTMLRSAAKNFAGVVVVVDPADYAPLLDELAQNGGQVSLATSYRLARKVFQHTSRYDSLISGYLAGNAPDGVTSTPPSGDLLTENITLNLARKSLLRYGENPHQPAAVYEVPGWLPPGLVQARQLQGKPLSFNNYLDLDAAWAVVTDFPETAVAIVKHTNPCGAAVADTPEQAYRLALESDPVSAYGGIVGSNRPVTLAMAEAMSGLFLEAVAAPGFDQGAREVLAARKNLRLLAMPPSSHRGDSLLPELRSISGGLLLQARDADDHPAMEDLTVVTSRPPTEEEFNALLLAWRVVRHLKSNAVSFASPERLLAMGCGQTSRVEAVRLAVAKSRLSLKGSALASDAFFPFRDGLDVAVESGATAVIQPGGSIRDQEVIQAADEHGIAMVFTGRRHFKH